MYIETYVYSKIWYTVYPYLNHELSRGSPHCLCTALYKYMKYCVHWCTRPLTFCPVPGRRKVSFLFYDALS